MTETKWQVKLQDNAMNWKSIWNNVFDSYIWDTQMEYVTCVAIILKPSVTCFSNVVKYNTYGKFALEK